jgi:hypothetical protein
MGSYMLSYIFLWAFIAYGMTSIIVWGSIFEKFRNWVISKSKFFGDLVSCVLCTSTWVGFFLSITFSSVSATFYQSFVLVNIFLDGMFSAGIVWTINAIVEYFEEKKS